MTVSAALALASRDAGGAADWLRRARETLVAVQRIAFGRGSVPAADVPAWTRMLGVAAELALASIDLDGACASAIEALSIARDGDQQPAATIALVSAARVLAAAGRGDDARTLITGVLDHPATPFDAVLTARRLDTSASGDGGGQPRSAPWDDSMMHERTVFTTLERTLERLRAVADRREG